MNDTININIIELIGYATVMYVVYYLIARLHRWYQSIEQLKYRIDKLECDNRCTRYKMGLFGDYFNKMKLEEMKKYNRIKRR